MNSKKNFLFLAMYLMSAFCFSQDNHASTPVTVKVKILPNSVLDTFLNDKIIVKLVSNKVKYDAYGYRYFASTEQELKLDRHATFHLMASVLDTYRVMVQTILRDVENGVVYDKLKEVLIEDVVLGPWEIRQIVVTFPMPCHYDSSFKKKTCPRCDRVDMAKRYVVTSCPITLPEEIENHMHWGDDINVDKNCMPNWYCERDKLEY